MWGQRRLWFNGVWQWCKRHGIGQSRTDYSDQDDVTLLLRDYRLVRAQGPLLTSHVLNMCSSMLSRCCADDGCVTSAGGQPFVAEAEGNEDW